MKSTADWLDAVKARHGLTSDYQLAQRWQVTRQQISAYRNGREYLSEEAALKAAADLEMAPGYVLACVAGERARMPSARAAWLELATRIGVVALVIGGALLVTEPLYNESFLILVAADCTGPLCIMLNPHIGYAAGILFILFNLLPWFPNKKN